MRTSRVKLPCRGLAIRPAFWKRSATAHRSNSLDVRWRFRNSLYARSFTFNIRPDLFPVDLGRPIRLSVIEDYSQDECHPRCPLFESRAGPLTIRITDQHHFRQPHRKGGVLPFGIAPEWINAEMARSLSMAEPNDIRSQVSFDIARPGSRSVLRVHMTG